MSSCSVRRAVSRLGHAARLHQGNWTPLQGTGGLLTWGRPLPQTTLRDSHGHPVVLHSVTRRLSRGWICQRRTPNDFLQAWAAGMCSVTSQLCVSIMHWCLLRIHQDEFEI